ncbi:MAG: flagellar protein FlaG [Mariprofundus sp.]|nr:flagellar protein FlaG [Mariprofundus sp.]
MNTISNVTYVSPAISSPGAGVATGKSAGGESSAPIIEKKVVQEAGGQPSLKDVQQAVKQANISVQGSNETISFGYEEQLGQLVVQVSDKATGQLIQQLPSKDFVQFQLHMRAMIGLLLDKQA